MWCQAFSEAVALEKNWSPLNEASSRPPAAPPFVCQRMRWLASMPARVP